MTGIVEDFVDIANRLRRLKGGAMCDCWNTAGHSYHCAIFKCAVCGTTCDGAPPEGPAYCPEHCPDHDYRYERGEGHRCVTCGADRPLDWFDPG